MELFTETGLFLYPLALCSLLALIVIFERLINLRLERILPESEKLLFTTGQIEQLGSDERAASGRIVAFARIYPKDREALRAFSQVEVSKMERGLFLLEIVIGAAPLIGLLGTVTGLTQVFGGLSFQSGVDDSEALIAGIAMALNTTILGLAIAIPTLAAYAYFTRKVDKLAAQLALGVEALSKR